MNYKTETGYVGYRSLSQDMAIESNTEQLHMIIDGIMTGLMQDDMLTRPKGHENLARVCCEILENQFYIDMWDSFDKVCDIAVDFFNQGE